MVYLGSEPAKKLEQIRMREGIFCAPAHLGESRCASHSRNLPSRTPLPEAVRNATRHWKTFTSYETLFPGGGEGNRVERPIQPHVGRSYVV